MQRIKICNKYISEKDPCFIVAEMSANHNQDLRLAKKIIKTAAKAGADAIKLQTYTPDSMTIPCNNKYFRVKHPKWRGQTLYELYRKAYTPWEWLKDLKKIAEDLGIIFFSTAFDKRGVDYLEKLNVPVHKVASFELVDLPLIRYMAQTRKPIILSTGMATLKEITKAVETARENGAENIILLKCVSAYPAKPEEMNLKTIPDMQKRFRCYIGLSDHTLGTATSIASVCLGARMIEKHLTLSRKMKSLDSFFSLEPAELKDMVENVRVVEKALGKVNYGLTKKEEQSRVFRRSIFAVKNIGKGEILTEENIRVIRPAGGLEPKHWEKLLGRKVKCDIKIGTPIKWEMV